MEAADAQRSESFRNACRVSNFTIRYRKVFFSEEKKQKTFVFLAHALSRSIKVGR
jgi:hypothetical protein